MIRPKITLKGKLSPKMRAIKDAMRRADGSSVTVGVHDGAGAYQDGTQVTQVALWNEFGTTNAPERSFIRSAINENGDKLAKWRKEALEDIALKGRSIENALTRIGLRVQVLIQNKIKSNVPPPNAPATVAAKQARGVAPRTLIDTTLLLRSIGFKVELARGQGEGKDLT